MAYDPNQQDPNAQAMGAPGQQVQLPTTSGPGAGPGPAGKGSAPQAAPQQPFQNLQAYLTANAPQVETQANTIAGNLTNQYGQVQGDINKGQSDFNSQVQGGYAAPNAALTNQAATNPTAVAASPTDLAGFQALYNDTYTGPSNYESSTPYSTLSQEVGSAANNATNFNSVPGMQTYFQGQNPNATAGGNTLDATLLATDPNAIQTVQAAAKPFGTLNDYLNGTVTSADQNAANAVTEAQNENQALHTQFTGAGGVVPTWQQGIADQTTKAQQAADAYNKSVNQVQQEVAGMGGKLGDTEAAIKAYNDQNYNPAAVGVSGNSKLPAINYDLSGLSKVPNTLGAATPESAASANDFATESALNKLLGLNLGNLNPDLANEAGTYQVPANASLPIQQAIDALNQEMTAANTGFTNNGALKYAGTPDNSIITNKDIPPGYEVVKSSDFGTDRFKNNPLPKNAIQLGQGDRFGNDYVAVPVGTNLPKEEKPLTTMPTGNTFHPSAAGISPSLGGPDYYSNQPLSNADKGINDLLTYLKGIQT